MADEDDTYGEQHEDSDGIRSLRKQYETTKKERDDALERLSGFEAKERTGAVAALLEAKGYQRSGARFYTGSDVSEQAVSAWLEENSDALARTVTPAEQQGPSAEEQAVARIAQAATGDDAPGGQNPLLIGDQDAVLRALNELSPEEAIKRFPSLFPPTMPGQLRASSI